MDERSIILLLLGKIGDISELYYDCWSPILTSFNGDVANCYAKLFTIAQAQIKVPVIQNTGVSAVEGIWMH